MGGRLNPFYMLMLCDKKLLLFKCKNEYKYIKNGCNLFKKRILVL